MTSTWRHPMKCQCGHEGNLKHRENDQPFSGPWESWSLEGFSGPAPDLGDDEEAKRVTCPACGQTGKVRFVK